MPIIDVTPEQYAALKTVPVTVDVGDVLGWAGQVSLLAPRVAVLSALRTIHGARVARAQVELARDHATATGKTLVPPAAESLVAIDREIAKMERTLKASLARLYKTEAIREANAFLQSLPGELISLGTLPEEPAPVAPPAPPPPPNPVDVLREGLQPVVDQLEDIGATIAATGKEVAAATAAAAAKVQPVSKAIEIKLSSGQKVTGTITPES